MSEDHIYCPECNRKVRVTLTEAPGHQGQATLPDGPEVVCLDFHDGCADGRCPLFDRPGIVMGVRLARSGLRSDEWKTVRGTCQGCGETTDLEVLSDDFAHCPLCDTTNQLILVELGGGGYLAVTEVP